MLFDLYNRTISSVGISQIDTKSCPGYRPMDSRFIPIFYGVTKCIVRR